MAKISMRGNTLFAVGEIGYDQAGEFATLCDRFLREHKTAEAIIDLSSASELVSPCLTAVYEDSRLHHPADLKVIVPGRLAKLFEPGEIEGLFKLEVI